MLDVLRRKKGSLVIKGILIAIALSFVIGFMLLPELRRTLTGRLDPNVVAKVGREKIPLRQYQRALQNTLAQFKALFEGEETEQIIQQLNLKQQVVQQMVDRRLLIQEARRLGLSVSDEELKQAIYNYEIDGHKVFVDETGWFDRERYMEIIRSSGFSVAEFENSFREDLLVEKIRQMIMEPIQVTEAEIREQYQLDHEKVSLRYVVLNPKAIEVEGFAEEELKTFYNENRDLWTGGERRRVAYLKIDPATVRERVEISEREIESYYKEHRDDYATPEEVHARHILIKVDSDAEEEEREAARERAEEILKRLREGADFEAMAKEYSEDPGSRSKGGDLGFFGRGRMVKPFEEVAFSLPVGELSDLVESPYGYHIIRVDERKGAGYRTLEEVRPQILQRLRREQSTDEIDKVARRLARAAKKKGDLQAVAEEYDLEVREVEIEEGENYLSGIPDSKAFIEAAESLEVDAVSPLVEGSRNRYLLQLKAIEPPIEKPFESVRGEVEREYKKRYRQEKAASDAARLLEKAKERGSLEKAAEEMGYKTEETGLFARRTDYVPRIGTSKEISQRAFALTEEDRFTEEPIVYQDRLYILELAEREGPDWDQFESDYLKERRKVLQRLRQSTLQAYIASLREETKVTINYESL